MHGEMSLVATRLGHARQLVQFDHTVTLLFVIKLHRSYNFAQGNARGDEVHAEALLHNVTVDES